MLQKMGHVMLQNTPEAKDETKDAAKMRPRCERPRCAQNVQQRCGKVGTQRCGKNAAKILQRYCKDTVQFQTASGNVAKWVTILTASSGHERNWDKPKNASRISQTTARTDSWTPLQRNYNSDSCPYITNPYGSGRITIPIELVYHISGLLLGL